MEKVWLDRFSQLLEITKRDHKSRALSVCEESAGVGCQSFPVPNVCYSSSTTHRACQGQELCPYGPPKANTGELFTSGFCSRPPCSARLPTFGSTISQAYPQAAKEKRRKTKKKVGQVKDADEGLKGFCRLG